MIYPFIETHEAWGVPVKLLVTELRDWNWCSFGRLVELIGESEARKSKQGFIADFRDRLPAGGLVFDLGANIGYLSTLFGLKVGPTGKVVSVEPHSGNLCKVGLHALLNGLTNIVPIHAAVMDKAGQLVHLRGEVVSENTESESHFATTTTIDELAGQYGIPDAIKIDVEGCELFALRGAANVLAAKRTAWTIEIHDLPPDDAASLSRFGHTAQQVFDAMLAAGYTASLDGKPLMEPIAASVFFVPS